MEIWLLHVGELLSIDGDIRPFRYGILADTLVQRGHKVVRWAPTFIHAYKKQRALHDKSVWVNPDYRIELVYARGYRRNVSLQRWRFHHEIEKKLLHRLSQQASHPDIILAGIPTPGMCLVALEYARKHHIPFVVDVRDLWPDIYLSILPKPLHPLANIILWPAHSRNRRLFQNSSAIFAVSESYLKWGLRYANRQQRCVDAVFPLGYPERSFSPQEIEAGKKFLAQKGVNFRKQIVSFLGQFESSYDLETVIEAARKLERKGLKKVQFVLCGSGSKEKAIKKLASGLSNVVFPGWVSASVIYALLKEAKIGLAPYTSNALQSIPNKPIEYMAGGLAVVSSLRGELAQLLVEYNCGITYSPGDSGELAAVLERLVTQPSLLEKMGRNARSLFERQFSVERIYLKMADYLEQISRGWKC